METILPLCKEFEEKLIKHIWNTRAISHRPTPSVSTASPTAAVSPEGSQTALNEKVAAEVVVEEVKPEKEEVQTPQPTAAPKSRSWWSWKLQPRPQTTSPSSDSEKGGKRKERKLVLIGPVYAGLGAGLAACSYRFLFILPYLDAYYRLPQTSFHQVSLYYLKNMHWTMISLVSLLSSPCLLFTAFLL